MINLFGFKGWEWLTGTIGGTIVWAFSGAKVYMGVMIALILANVLIGVLVKCFYLKKEFKMRKFFEFVIQIMIVIILMPSLYYVQETFPKEIPFDAARYVTLVISIALLSSILANAGTPFGVNIKEIILSRIPTAETLPSK